MFLLANEPQRLLYVTFSGLGGYAPYRVCRLSPSGTFYMYDAAYWTGFRLKVAERRRFGGTFTLNELGWVGSFGSRWAD